MWNKHLAIVLVSAIISLFVMWMPFLLKTGTFWGIDFAHRNMQTIVSNFDGINFLVVAKSMYDPHVIEINYPSILAGRQNLYFSAHYPGLPLVIRTFDVFLNGPNALLASIVLSNILLTLGLFLFFKIVIKDNTSALFASLVALFLPARMLSMRIVGSNESLFIFFVLASLIANYKSKHFWAGLFGAFAVLTRSPGILLFITYMFNPVLHWVKTKQIAWREILPYSLIPFALVGLWAYYGIVFGDFLAYFKVGGNINLYFPPFMIFGSHFDWISGMWNEDIIYTYIFYSASIYLFFKNVVSKNLKLNTVGQFATLYLAMIFFVVHRDIARYALPIAPVAIAGISPYLESKYVRYGLCILAIPTMLYAWNFILNNVQPIMDWSQLL